jgi:hypothetical protein
METTFDGGTEDKGAGKIPVRILENIITFL